MLPGRSRSPLGSEVGSSKAGSAASSSLQIPEEYLGSSSPSLQRRSSHPSHRGGLVPSPRSTLSMLPPVPPGPSSSSSLSESRSGSHTSTPRLQSRRNSTKERSSGILSRRASKRRAEKDEEASTQSHITASSSGEPPVPSSPKTDGSFKDVIETPQLRLDRDPETGRKMVNQYLVLHEIGHGTHGRVRLGRDMSAELSTDEGEDATLDPANKALYAIKIVDRNSKKKRLAGLSRQKARNDGGKMVNETEIRKEIAIFKKVNHPNVVRMKEIIDDPESSKLFMILEYCEGGEIQWRDGHNDPALSLDEIRHIFRDTVLGLEYLHHQGIIHRDIKPSNLLLARDGTVKISDFGCSHYSEALRAASAMPGPEGEEYVDDIELAKTAGSPAFFAPEMCYSGTEADLSLIAKNPPTQYGHETSDSYPAQLKGTNDPQSSNVHLPERLPITNAIDVWALGVTFFCLLFGRTPFDAINEYQLMQVIPTVELPIPEYMTRDRLSTKMNNDDPSATEVRECLDLLRRLLEKDPLRRITLEQAKTHPFTLRGLPDPTTWLASTDPHAQSFVTVSNDEVAAVVIKSSSFREKFKKGIRTISNKLQIFNSVGRSRSQSIGDGVASTPLSHSSVSTPFPVPPVPPSTPMYKGTATRNDLVASARSPLASPAVQSPGPSASISRRLSLRRKSRTRGVSTDAVSSTVESTVPSRSLSSHINSPNRIGTPIQRSLSSQLLQIPSSSTPNVIPLNDDPPDILRPAISSLTLDEEHSGETSRLEHLRQRRSSDFELANRQLSPGSSGIGSGFGKIARLLSRNNSQRTRGRFRRREIGSEPSETDDPSMLSGNTSPGQSVIVPSNLDADERLHPSTSAVDDTSSVSSIPAQSQDRDPAPTPSWESRLHLGYSPRLPLDGSKEREVEEVDWNEPLSDDDDDEDEEVCGQPIRQQPFVVEDASFPSSGNAPHNTQPPSAFTDIEQPGHVYPGGHEFPSHYGSLPTAASSDRSSPPRGRLGRRVSSSIVEEDNDGALAISVGTRRDRTLSVARPAIK